MRRDLQAQELFAERYRLAEPLGEGSSGVVWRVHDLLEDRTCALKLLKPGRSSADHLERFKREFRATARLDHPHCIHCHELGVHQGQAYFTMEFVAGGSLQLERWEDPAAVVDLGRQILAGLDHIHARGIIHRDLKPQNIFVEQRPTGMHARLGDFGIVKVADFRDEGFGLGDVLGSLRFLAPESLEHGTADPRSDLYALGIILYWLLAGEHPLATGRQSAREWLALHRRGEMRPLVRSDVPEALVAIIERLCHRRPDARFPSAAAAYDALDALELPAPTSFVRATPPPLQRRPHLAAPVFVGRDAELEQARSFCERALAGEPGASVLFIEGVAGLGKSRLMRELLADALERDVLVFTGTCPAEGAAPYLPLYELLHDLEGVKSSEPDSSGSLTSVSSIGTMDVHRVRAASGDDPTVQVRDSHDETPVRTDLPGPSVGSGAPVLSPEDQAMMRMRMHEQLARQLFELCARRPVLVVVDDAQWADVPTLQLLGSMARTVALMRDSGQRWPIGFILTHRPFAPGAPLEELREAVAACRAREDIVLGPLADEAATALVASMLMVEPEHVPLPVAAPLMVKAEGSPLFLSQIMQLLVGKGSLTHDERGRWRLDDLRLEATGLPASVALAIGERAARLATSSKQLLATAAVVGKQFDVAMLAAILDESEPVLLDSLDELVRGEFIEDAPSGYRFVHDRIRESIYDTLEDDDRRRLHGVTALVLREGEGSRPRAWPVIAHHFEQAGEYARAHAHALRSAEHANQEHAHGAAEQMYAMALRVAEHDDSIEVPTEIWERYGDACAALGHYAKAVECYRRRLDAEPEVVERRVVLSKVGALEYKRGQFKPAVSAMEQVLDLAGFVPPRSELAVRLRTLGQAVRVLLAARPWTGSLEDGDARARSCALTAESWYFAGNLPRSVYFSMLSANTARRVGPSPGSVRALSGFGYALTTYGLHRQGARFMDMARDFGERTKLPASDACWLEVMHGLTLAARGRAEHSLAIFNEASNRFDDSANAEARLLSYTNHTLIRLAVGRDFPRVQRVCAKLRHLAEETNDARAMGWSGEGRGHLALRRGQFEDGFATMRLAADRCLGANDRTYASSINDTMALFLAVEGEHAEALERGQLAAETALDHGLRHYVPLDGGLVVAAALAKFRGEELPPGVQSLVGRVLRWRRFVVMASRLTELRFGLGKAAWRAAHGKSADFDRVIEQATKIGFIGEAWMGHRVAAEFDRGERTRHLDQVRTLGERFEQA